MVFPGIVEGSGVIFGDWCDKIKRLIKRKDEGEMAELEVFQFLHVK